MKGKTNNQIAKKQTEREVFCEFLGLMPEFAGEPIREWQSPHRDPPDIISIAESGRKVGVELVEWLAQTDLEAGKLTEEMNRLIMEALGEPQPPNPAKNFNRVRFAAKRSIEGKWLQLLKSAEGKKRFREDFLAALRRFDEELSASGSSVSPQGRRVPLEKYPELSPFLEEVRVYKEAGDETATNWIEPFPRGGPWDPENALKTLAMTVKSKTGKQMATPCDEYVLLVYYFQGWEYAAPLVLPHLPSPSQLSEGLRGIFPNYEDRKPFSKAYLYSRPDKLILRLW